MGREDEILKYPIDSLEPETRVVGIGSRNKESLIDLCRRIRDGLVTHHIICPEARAKELIRALRREDDEIPPVSHDRRNAWQRFLSRLFAIPRPRDISLAARAVLKSGYHRLVVIEMSRGLDNNGRYDHEGHFLPYVKDVLYCSFGVDPTDDYHPEQIVQVVKDEPPSLFCFLDAQHIQGPDVQRLRIFTQGHHRVLICALPSPRGSNISRSAFTTPRSGRVVTATGPPHSYIVPTLQIMNGPMAGRLYKLDRDVVIVGRNPDCDVVLQPKSVSRKHAAIVRKGMGFEIKDLGSTGGTFANGQRLTNPILLVDGSLLQIGELQLTFNSRVVHERDDFSEFEMSSDTAAIDVLDKSDRNFPLVKPETKFRALRQISQDVGEPLILSEVLDRIFNSLFEIFPRAERGFVLLKDPGSEALQPEIIRSRTGPAGELKFSKTVVNRVLNAGQAILCKDLAQEFPESASVSESKIRSLMCVPLLDSERKPVGIMQIDTRDGRSRFEQDDLDLLAAVASQISVAVQNTQLHKALIKQREMEHELQFARQVMQSLLPEWPDSVPGYDFWAYYEPARHVGGDYHGIMPIGPDSQENGTNVTKWAIAVGDPVGKGMPAALLTAKLSAEVRMLLRGNPVPTRVVEQLNHQFDGGGLCDSYITFLLIVLDVEEHRMSVVNAGHPCPLILRRDGRLEEFGRSSSGLPLAITPNYRYELAETTLEPGETVVLYTDGVTDAMNSAGDRFGHTAFQDAIMSAGTGTTAVGDAVVKAMQTHVADRPQFDDITLVCMARR